MANNLVTDIADNASELRISLRRNKLQTQEITEMLYRLGMSPRIVKLLEQCKAIDSDLHDAIVRAEKLLASEILAAKQGV